MENTCSGAAGNRPRQNGRRDETIAPVNYVLADTPRPHSARVTGCRYWLAKVFLRTSVADTPSVAASSSMRSMV
jgi:hypothetical protein